MKLTKSERKTMFADALEARAKRITVDTLILRRRLAAETINKLKMIDLKRAA